VFFLSLCRLRIADAQSIEFFGIHRTADKKLCSGKPEFLKTPPLLFLAYFLGNVKPRQRRTGQNLREGLMDCVVRADEKVRSSALKRMGGTQHQDAHCCPVSPGDMLYILRERDCAERDFRMSMFAHECFRFKTERAITKRSAI
jgi:hypothetical protein